jgi:hypothetical protein
VIVEEFRQGLARQGSRGKKGSSVLGQLALKNPAKGTQWSVLRKGGELNVWFNFVSVEFRSICLKIAEK